MSQTEEATAPVVTFDGPPSFSVGLMNAFLNETEATNAASDTETHDEEPAEKEEEEGEAAAAEAEEAMPVKALPLRDINEGLEASFAADGTPLSASIVTKIKEAWKERKAKKKAKKAAKAQSSVAEPVRLGNWFERKQSQTALSDEAGAEVLEQWLVEQESKLPSQMQANLSNNAKPLGDYDGASALAQWVEENKKKQKSPAMQTRLSNESQPLAHHEGASALAQRIKENKKKEQAGTMQGKLSTNPTPLAEEAGLSALDQWMKQSEPAAKQTHASNVPRFSSASRPSAQTLASANTELLSGKVPAAYARKQQLARVNMRTPPVRGNATEIEPNATSMLTYDEITEYMNRTGAESMDGFFSKLASKFMKTELLPGSASDSTIPAVLLSKDALDLADAANLRSNLSVNVPGSLKLSNDFTLKKLAKGPENVVVFDGIGRNLRRDSFFKDVNGQMEPRAVDLSLTNPWNNQKVEKALIPKNKVTAALRSSLVWVTESAKLRMVLRFDSADANTMNPQLMQLALVNLVEAPAESMQALASLALQTLSPAETALAELILAGQGVGHKSSAVLVDPVNTSIALATAMSMLRTAFPKLEVFVRAEHRDTAEGQETLRKYATSVEQLVNAIQATGQLSTPAAAQRRGMLLATHIKAQLAGGAQGSDNNKVLASLNALDSMYTVVRQHCVNASRVDTQAFWNASPELRQQPTALYNTFFKQ